VSQPNILAANNKEATLRIGEERVMVTGATANVLTNENSTRTVLNIETDKQNIGTTLSIWPRINGDRTVTLDITQSNTSLNAGAVSLPVSTDTGIATVAIDTVSGSTIDLTAIARHGATIAIGGMIETDRQDVHEKVPLLGDIPLLGKLFRKDYSVDARSELIVLITPWISEDPASAHRISQQRLQTWSEDEGIGARLSEDDTDSAGITIAWPKPVQNLAMALLRFAASAGRENGLATCIDGSTAGTPRFQDWQLAPELSVDAVAHCRHEGLLLTQAQVHNRSTHSQTLQPTLFTQGWIASSGESGLVPANTSRWLYLVSARPPEQLLRERQAAFFLGPGALDAQ
jgi:hypothetical protein